MNDNARYTAGDRDAAARHARAVYNKQNERARMKHGPQLVSAAPLVAVCRYALAAGISKREIATEANIGYEHFKRILAGKFPQMRRVYYDRVLRTVERLAAAKREALADCQSALTFATSGTGRRGGRDGERWPVAPLLDRIQREVGPLDHLPNNNMRRNLYRVEWLSTETADRYAVALGWTPEEVWGPAWFGEMREAG